MTPPEHLLTVREVAAYLSCAEETVKRLVRRGSLSAVRLGPRLRFRQQDVERYLALHQQKAAHDARPPLVEPAHARSHDGEILYAIAVATAGEDRLERILAATLEELGRVIVFTGGSIALVEGDELVICAAVGPFADTALGLRQPRGAGLAWQVITTGQPFLSHDVLADGLRPTSNFRSYLAVPLTWRGTTIGMLEVDSVTPRAFSERDMALLGKVAMALSGSVELARRYTAEVQALAAADSAQRRLQVLAEASAAFAAARLDLAAVMAIVTRRVAEVIGDGCTVMLLSDDGARLDLTASYHPDPAMRERVRAILAAAPYKVGTGAISAVIQSGQPVLVPALTPDQLRAVTNPGYWPYLDQTRMASLLIVPLRVQGRVLGVLALTRDEPGRPYTPDDQQLLQDLADRAALAVDNARLYAAMQADVGARKQAELELKASRDQLAIILGGVADGITAEDRRGRLVYANDAAAQANGFPSAQALLGAPPEATLRKFIVLDESGAPFPLDQLPGGRALQGEPSPSAVIRFRPAEGGEERWSIVGSRAVLDERGTPQLAISIFRDVTAQKRAEQHQRFLTAASAVLASSLDSRATLENLARLTVPTLGDWCVVDMLQDDGAIRPVAIAHADPSKVAVAWEMLGRYPVDPAAPFGTGQVLRSGEPELVPLVPDEVLRSVAHNDEHFELLRALGLCSTICVPLLIDGRAVGTIALVSSDPLRRYGADDLVLAVELARRAAIALMNARLYARAERAREQAEEAVRQRDMFFSIAAHELRTPLTSLLGQAQLLQRRGARAGTLGERDQRSVEVVISQAQRLNKLVLALLDLARIEQGRLSIETAPLDLCALARRVVAETQPMLERYTLEAELPDAPLVVLGDELRLDQVLQNLITNGLRYSPEGSAVEVRLERNDERALLTVSDRGIGIPAAAIPQLFQRFFRAENASAHHRAGLGIGLYVVREIVTLHGGSVEVESVEGQGSTFRVSLPLHVGEPEGQRISNRH